ncbi:type I polyketide synthase [Actinophytocola oryzae]|uniref:Acyl transferase domain-containing protein n=1 Tax=Actinophytocola oryzae TaxID=502181 RepID=A0A4R7W0T0_9PSEU|nr:type I polyketide synthase [Actinophytocola oryzae]TDV56123.1 acyl transferase domain-containing protein [Actinophytocola oryzae]
MTSEPTPYDSGEDAGAEDLAGDISGDIAIVGVAGQFPGSRDVRELWRNLRAGKNLMTQFSDEELRASGVSDELLDDPTYVRVGSILDDVDKFDAGFFGYAAREAQVMDPQQRLFLQNAWHALEDAGVDPDRAKGAIGVFAGAQLSTYMVNNIAPHPGLIENTGMVFVGLGNDKDSLPTRVSHAFDLTGPSYGVQSYCSTSLVAVSAACSSLVMGESDYALAGGVAVTVPQRVGYLYVEAGMSSPDGMCRAFDAEGKGTPLGNGVGVVVLRRLEDALADGDRVYAVIRGWAVNNDGSMKVGFTAPGVRGQAGVVAEALAAAGLSPADIDYVEAHGTGTPLGDAAEIAALQQVFDVEEVTRVRVGSAKTNMGHLDRAAGVTGLIKASLAMHNQVIPPTVNYATPNPQLVRSKGRIEVVTELTPWERNDERVRRAGVSAFGMGGTNAHVVLEEVTPVDREDREDARPHQVLVWSARTATAGTAATERLAATLSDLAAGEVTDGGAVELADVAYTLQVGRKVFHERRAAVVADAADGATALGTDAAQRVLTRSDASTKRPVGFLIAGVGEHYKGMIGGLYRSEPVFRAAIDECAAIFRAELGSDPLAELVADEKSNGADLARLLGRTAPGEDESTSATEVVQPAVFAVDYALGKLLMAWGIEPSILAGYSVGEFAAAALAEALTLDEAARLVSVRAKLIAGLPAGAMAAVPLSVAELGKLVGAPADLGLDVAAVNGTQMIVVAGPVAAVEDLTNRLAEHDVPCRRLRTAHAFHSRMLRPVADELTAWARENLSPKAPRIPYLSNVTGAVITERQLRDPGYWAEHMCRTVKFADMLATLLAEGEPALVEIGPGQSLGAITRNHPDCPPNRWPLLVPTLPAEADPRADTEVLAEGLAKLWLSGVDIDWHAYHEDRLPRKVSIPNYPFEKQSYWIDPPAAAPRQSVQAPAVLAAAPVVEASADDNARFWGPVWAPTPLGVPDGTAPTGPVWILTDGHGVGEALAARFATDGRQTVVVRRGEALAEGPQWTIRPGEAEDYERLFTSVGAPSEVVHLFGLDDGDPRLLGFDSVCRLTALLGSEVADPVRITVVTSSARPVLDTDVPDPHRATVYGACIVASQEFAGLLVRSVDVTLGDTPSSIAAGLHAESRVADAANAVALRDGTRYVLDMRPTPATDNVPVPVKAGGVYLITGGLGPVGRLMAGHVGAGGENTIVLAGRSGLPPEQEWDALIAEGDTRAERLLAVRQLREGGVRVEVAAADMTDETAVRRLVDDLFTRHGRLDGVIHLAANTDPSTFGPITELRPDQVDAHFGGGKIDGTVALETVLADYDVEFVVLFSSMSAVLGGLGFAPYVAANTFLDTIPYRHRDDATRWVAINWDTWAATAAMIDDGGIGDLGATMVEYSMSEQEALDAFDHVLAHPLPRTTVSAGDLPQRTRQWLVKDITEATSSSGVRLPRPDLPQDFVPATNDLQRLLAGVWEEMLGIDRVGVRDNFFDLGGTSLMGLQLVKKMQKASGATVSAVNLFEAPTVHAMALLIESKGGSATPKPAEKPVEKKVETPARAAVTTAPRGDEYGDKIAIIGLSGRFPGANDVGQFWRNLSNGVESVTTFSPEELLDAGVSPDLVNAPNYVPKRPVLDNIREFDGAFFGYSPREAEITDPQHRLFLEVCWEALEDGGYGTSDGRGRVGVFGGSNISTYMIRTLMASKTTDVGEVDAYQFIIGNDKDSLTTSISYKLGLTGPSFTVQTFCSTALVATHLACQSLRHNECELALAGGVSIHVPDRVGHLYVPGGMESPDGKVHTFDADAQGTMFGDGAGVVLLKRLSDAVRDGDTVYAVIRGSAVNNDGSLKVGYTAPSVVGQSDVVADAMANAGVTAEDIGYVEAHGTATPLGDPIEVAALTRAFGDTEQKQYVPIGSVKTNIGHLAAAAGISGLIKTTMALRHKQIPPSLNFNRPSPEIDFENSPFYVNTELSPWESRGGKPRIAGLNSLGMGGTNVHMIIEEAPAPAEPAVTQESPDRRYELIRVSGRNAASADQSVRQLADHLARRPDVPLRDVANTLHLGRETFEHRRAWVTDSMAEIVATAGGADRALPPGVLTRAEPNRARPVNFMFAGVGEHYPGMIVELYRREPLVRSIVDECAAVMREALDVDLLPLLTAPRSAGGGQDSALLAMLGRSAEETDPNREALRRTEIAQPAVFVVEYAVARLLMSWGIQPSVMLGYSLGEYVAACLAGVLPLADALRLVAFRADLISRQPAGSMLAVPRSPEWLTDRFGDLGEMGIDIASVNGPEITVLGGEPQVITDFAARLQRDDVPSTKLLTTHAFHTRMLAPLAAELTAWVKENLRPRAPRLSYISNVTGKLADEALVTDPEYWARHMCSTVRFADGLAQLLADQDPALLEIGPGQSLSAMTRVHPDCARERWPLVTATLPASADPRPDDRTITDALAVLWLAGVEIDWAAYQNARPVRRVPLPTYPFQRQEYWLAGESTQAAPATVATSATPDAASALTGLPLLPEEQWVHTPVWHQTAPRAGALPSARWLVFTHEPAEELRTRLTARFEAAGGSVVLVRPGEAFASTADGYVVRPGESADLRALLRELRDGAGLPERVLHLWTVAPPAELDLDVVDTGVAVGPHSIIALAQAASDVGVEGYTIDIVTSGFSPVTGAERIRPEVATILGPVRLVPVEYSGVSCRLIDLDPAELANPARVVPSVVAEIGDPEVMSLVALRAGRRWLLDYESVPVADDGTSLLRDKGVYLITGGLGGIGLAMAEQLAVACEARLVLFGRTGLPPRDTWDAVLASDKTGAEVRRRLEGVKRVEELGAEVLVVTGDVADRADVEAAVKAATGRFGGLDGVLHAAGVPGVGLMQFKTKAEIEKTLAPKVAGTLALDAALADHELDFLVLFSSITSATGGGPGQVDYCAANSFVDAFAHATSQRSDGRRTVAINWGEWEWNGWEAGLSGYSPEVAQFFRDYRAEFGIPFAAGWRSLLRALGTGLTQVAVTTQDFAKLAVAGSGVTVQEIAALGVADEESTGGRHPRPELSVAFVAPDGETEVAIAEVWADMLGLERVGTADNFFELGGNSLVGVEIMIRIRRRLGIEELAPHVLYEAPTVGALARLLSTEAGEQPVVDIVAAQDRSNARKANLARRKRAS